MPVTQNIISGAFVNNLGPNIPPFFSLSQLVMRNSETSNSSNTGETPPDGDYSLPAFPNFGYSGQGSPVISGGVNVATFWQALSGTVN